MRVRLSTLTLALALAWPGAAAAQQVSLEGYFIALSDCEANKKKDSDNPGNVRLEVLRAYEMLARNSTPGTHYQVKVPGAPVTEQRWVPMSCGAYAPEEFLVRSTDTPPPPPPDGLEPDSIELVLAASWQPGFCATGAGEGKVECETQTADRPDATQFSIHGLWPDDLDDTAIFPCYCDRGEPISCRRSQERDAAIAISQDVLNELIVLMPGVMSGLHLHEWPKHGACYEDDETGGDKNADPDEYFEETMALARALNATAVKDLFVDHIGDVLTRDEIEAAFDTAFGDGAGERVLVRCSGSGDDRVITELWISLKGDVADPPDLAALILAAPPASDSSTQSSCSEGRVVEVTAN